MNIDIPSISQKLHIPPGVYRRILKKSLTTTAEDIALLEKGVSASDYEQVKLVAHRLKGVYSNLHIEELRKAAESLSRAAKAQGSREKMAVGLEQLLRAFGDLKSVLEKLEKS